ncbi:GIY-YIG nuclease family protein [Rhodohalobacter sp. SW132]|uniref:GIY-YIG nuclease family protein n=1 Tax=Rhodohalobacter sp. SW132 TaxID=2293433 RepID=UPI000E222627|nr:GIY-YIG nuclease family protein [Rhodohalobacter sp. SW132]REL39126.1 GIY-YIG nuclease family protein [Rhodohalobacter sp. SW132]
MYTVYILYSQRINQYYTGHAQDLKDRFKRHNEGRSLATKRGVPWELKKAIGFETRSEAMKAENWLKRMKSRKVIEKVISGEINLREVTD